jgi:hypothetical protein
LTDPVERYLAELGHASKIPSRLKDQSTGGTVLLANNIAFFSQTGGPNNGGVGLTIADCTFENPCGPTDFTQTSVTTLGGLLPNTQLYFNDGTYTSNGPVSLDPGQSLQSRSADYSQPATGAARSTIAGRLSLQGNNTVENMIFSTNTVDISGANNVITGVQIGSPSSFLLPAIIIEDTGSSTLISDSILFGNTFGVDNSGSNTTIQNSQIFVTGPSEAFGGAAGIIAFDGSISVNNSQIQVTSDSSGTPVGFFTIFNGSITSNNTNVIAIDSNGAAYGIQNNSAVNSIVVNGGNLSVQGDGSSQIINPISNPVTIQGGTVCQVNGTIVVCP